MSATGARIVQRLHGDPPLDARDVSAAMSSVREVPLEDVELVNSIVPNAGNYLDRSYITSLIRADVSEAEAGREIKRQMEFFERLRWLLPDLLNYFRFDEFMTELKLLHHIDDCFQDFPIILSSKRRDRKKREILEALSNASDRVRETRAALETVKQTVGYEFESARRLYYKHVFKRPDSDQSFDDLIFDLKLCTDAIELSLHRAMIEDDYLFISGNQARSELVDCAYELSLFYNGPSLVTTPGSDFSSLCSLLYEIVTGQPDHSLAGAINRYARSPDRRKVDEHHAEWLSEEEVGRERDADNFYDRREGVKHLLAEFDRWRNLSASPGLTDDVKVLTGLQMREAIEKAKGALEEYGPHLVWADQRDPGYFAEMRQETEELEAKIRKANLELGQHRRGKPRST